jgi:hypothetical protein
MKADWRSQSHIAASQFNLTAWPLAARRGMDGETLPHTVTVP